jgi:hypothetical protein
MRPNLSRSPFPLAAALAGALIVCAATPRGTDGAAGWTATAIPDIRSIVLAGNDVWTISYTVGSQTKMTATAFQRASGRERWKIALDHMRSDIQHVEAAGTSESLYVTVGDPLDVNKGYFLSLHVDPGAFALSPARPGQRPGVAVIGNTVWTTEGGGEGGAVKWRALNDSHNKFAKTLGVGASPGCAGRPAKHGRVLLVPEAGGITIASAATSQVVKRVAVSSCTWGTPAVLGPTVAVMSKEEGGSMTVAGVDPIVGRVRWRVKAPPNPTRTPYVPTLTASGPLALATYAKKAFVIDGAGRVRREVALEGVTRAAPASKGRVVCALKSRAVVMVDLAAGTTRSLAKMNSEIGALLVAPDGHVYVAASEELRDLGVQ